MRIGRYSIGWRMGYGEEYKYAFGEWYDSLSLDEQKLYQKMFPETKGWLGWYEEEDNDIYDDCYLLWNEEGKMQYNKNLLKSMVDSGFKN
jgi:hypothetical protein